MAKSKSQKGATLHAEPSASTMAATKPQIYDAALTTLFAKSIGPVTTIAKSATKPAPLAPGDDILSEAESVESSGSQSDASNGRISQPRTTTVDSDTTGFPPSRKRKRWGVDDDVEGRYMSQLAREEFKENERHGQTTQNKRRSPEKLVGHTEEVDSSNGESGSGPSSVDDIKKDEDDSMEDVPQHETMVTSKEDLDLEKSSRTVFLANVSTLAIKSKTAKKTLLDHLASFASELPTQNAKHGVESLRFRSTAFASTGIPRKAAFARKELMDTTTKSTNAYAVYTTQLAAREATKRLNGTMVLERHLRVDAVAHPAKTDHRRCVFVGNLGFVDDASNMNAAEDEENNKRPRKAKEPADIEEGLWRQFGNAGTVESIRVVRDKTTRVGKGFAYVQFEDANAVETALLYNEKKFPPMLPRILRVTRAKNIKKMAGVKDKGGAPKKNGRSTASYKPKIPSQTQSLTGRAGKLLGRAGAAQIRAAGGNQVPQSKKPNGIAKSPETIIFEGYRASRQQGKGVLKMGGSGKKHGKPSARSKDFKAKGRQKG